MRIVIASSEAVPYSKTGGLADVAGALVKALAAAGHAVTLVVPFYGQLQRQAGRAPAATTGQPITIPIGGHAVTGHLFWDTIPAMNSGEQDVTVLFVDQPDYFDRPKLYGDEQGDYSDNCPRYLFFSRAVMEACRTLVLRPDVIHANDWQTGLVPALLATEYRDQPGFQQTGSVFTSHNLAYQGQFWHWDMGLTGLDWKHFNWREMEHFGGLNLLKTGIAFADIVTTVSPTYAWEITTPLGGMSLEGALNAKGTDLVGILNGIDPEEWNPATDPHLVAHYDVETVFERKRANKSALQQAMNLPQRDDLPLFSMVSRMADQKGFDLIATAADDLGALNAQFLFLGTGDPRYERLVQHLANSRPDRIAAVIGFDEGLAHRAQAGSDACLMPSRYEPCGLNQMYALRYGTLPVARAVGGLKDTVVDASPKTMMLGTANGFLFEEYTAAGLLGAIRRAVDMFPKKTLWNQLVRTGMGRDFSWTASAKLYEEVYRRAADRHR